MSLFKSKNEFNFFKLHCIDNASLCFVVSALSEAPLLPITIVLSDNEVLSDENRFFSIISSWK